MTQIKDAKKAFALEPFWYFNALFGQSLVDQPGVVNRVHLSPVVIKRPAIISRASLNIGVAGAVRVDSFLE